LGIEWAAFLHRGLLIILGLVGFQGLFSQTHLVKKALAWMVFQTSLVLLWLSIAEHKGGFPGTSASGSETNSALNPLPHAIAFSLFLVSIGVLLALLVFSAGVYRQRGTFLEGELGKRKLK
jgi:multisubunit Na+/H+ antiporter MnhC subunit